MMSHIERQKQRTYHFLQENLVDSFFKTRLNYGDASQSYHGKEAMVYFSLAHLYFRSRALRGKAESLNCTGFVLYNKINLRLTCRHQATLLDMVQ